MTIIVIIMFVPSVILLSPFIYSSVLSSFPFPVLSQSS